MKATPAVEPLKHPTFPRPRIRTVVVDGNGTATFLKYSVQIGAEFKTLPATVIFDGTYASVYVQDHLVRHLKIDPTRRYQPRVAS